MVNVFRSKYSFYVIGILILTLGIAFTIQSDLGASPYDALLVGLSRQIGLTVGSWEIIISFLLIFCNALLKRLRPEFLGLLTAFITGIGIDVWLFLLQIVQPELLVNKVICFIIGIIISGIGTAVYLLSYFAPMPLDRLMLVICDLTKMNLLYSKTLVYVIFLILAFIFKGPIGIGTLLTVCLGGPILNYFMPYVEKIMNSLMLENDKTSTNHYEKINHP